MLIQVTENCECKAKADKHVTLCVENKPGSKIPVVHPAVLGEKKTPN